MLSEATHTSAVIYSITWGKAIDSCYAQKATEIKTSFGERDPYASVLANIELRYLSSIPVLPHTQDALRSLFSQKLIYRTTACFLLQLVYSPFASGICF